jgi:hypothetical protein
MDGAAAAAQGLGVVVRGMLYVGGAAVA